MSKALRGDLEIKQIKLGAGRVFIGQASTTTFAGTSKFDTAAPAAGWRDIGCIAQDVNLNLTVDQFAFKSGVPSTRKKTYIVGRDGTIQVNTEEFSAYLNKLALGVGNVVNKLGATLYTVTSYNSTTKVLVLDSTTGLTAGDEIVGATLDASLGASDNKALIATVDSGTQVTLRTEASFYTALTGSDKVREIVSTKLVFAGSQVPTYPMLFVVDMAIDIGATTGKQIVYLLHKVSAKGDYTPRLGGGTQNAMNQITFDIYGMLDSDISDISLASCFIFESES